MIEKVGDSGRASERKKGRAEDCVFALLVGAMYERDIRSLESAWILDGH